MSNTLVSFFELGQNTVFNTEIDDFLKDCKSSWFLIYLSNK